MPTSNSADDAEGLSNAESASEAARLEAAVLDSGSWAKYRAPEEVSEQDLSVESLESDTLQNLAEEALAPSIPSADVSVAANSALAASFMLIGFAKRWRRCYAHLWAMSITTSRELALSQLVGHPPSLATHQQMMGLAYTCLATF